MPTTTRIASTANWTIEGYCAEQVPSDLISLPASSLAFVEALNLSPVHPFCRFTSENYQLPGIPGQGPLLHNDHLECWWDVIVTILAMGLPSLWAMTELWLRLFASIVAPVGVAHLVIGELMQGNQNNNNSSRRGISSNGDRQKTFHGSKHQRTTWIRSILLLWINVSVMVLLTDTLYVLEWGAKYGMTMFFLSIVLSWRVATRENLIMGRIMIIMVVVITLYISIQPTPLGYRIFHVSFGGSTDDQAWNVPEGLYYDTTKESARRIVSNWPEEFRTYKSTPWMPTGDSRTGLPFLLNRVPEPLWTRLWLPVDNEEEVVALDIAFPVDGYDPSKPVYLLLHGLNGGSSEEYVKDFTQRRVVEKSTVVVMVARGLQELPIRGWNIFHGARWSDAHEAALALKKVMGKNQVLAGVGYSMGAIIMSNYVARSGSKCPLDAAVAIAGGLDMRFEEFFYRAQRLWQPMLATTLRDKFVVGKWGERVHKRLTKQQLKRLMRATHVTEIDETAVVVYNGFRDLQHYYTEMSALGDIPLEEYASDRIAPTRRINSIAIPFCVLHALDDPLVTWRTVAANDGWMHPLNLTKLASGNLFVLLTKRGGHVGWPLGWLPQEHKWKYMNDVAMSFVEAVATTLAERDIFHAPH